MPLVIFFLIMTSIMTACIVPDSKSWKRLKDFIRNCSDKEV